MEIIMKKTEFMVTGVDWTSLCEKDRQGLVVLGVENFFTSVVIIKNNGDELKRNVVVIVNRVLTRDGESAKEIGLVPELRLEGEVFLEKNDNNYCHGLLKVA